MHIFQNMPCIIISYNFICQFKSKACRTDLRIPWWNTCLAFTKPEFNPQHQKITISIQKDNFNLKLYLLLIDILREEVSFYNINLISFHLRCDSAAKKDGSFGHSGWHFLTRIQIYLHSWAFTSWAGWISQSRQICEPLNWDPVFWSVTDGVALALYYNLLLLQWLQWLILSHITSKFQS